MYKYSCVLLSLVCFCVVMSNAAFSMEQNVIPEFDICANGGDALTCSNHGSCVSGQCVCTDGYTGRDCSLPPGGYKYKYPMPAARATKFANLNGKDGQLVQTTCFGNFPSGQWVSKKYLPHGVTGIAAVNPTLYGSRFAFGRPNQYTSKTVTGSYSGVGQSCGHCFNVTKGSNSAIVMVVNRCGGFCKANSALGPCNANGTTSTDCGYCVTPTTTPTTVGCSCMSDTAIQTNGWCDANQAHHCDHCAQNDHPHFDLDDDTLAHVCGSATAGVCDLDSFQWVECSGIVAAKNSFPNGATPKVYPSNVQQSTTETPAPTPSPPTPAQPTQIPITPRPISITQAPTQTSAPTRMPPSAPTTRPTPIPTQAPTQTATLAPTGTPTLAPTQTPTLAPTQTPTLTPTQSPTQVPTKAPTLAPTSQPTQQATQAPSRSSAPQSAAVLRNSVVATSCSGVAVYVNTTNMYTASGTVHNIYQLTVVNTGASAITSLAINIVPYDANSKVDSAWGLTASGVNQYSVTIYFQLDVAQRFSEGHGFHWIGSYQPVMSCASVGTL